jgi:enoyl-CoA hydratase/carnithine racemase
MSQVSIEDVDGVRRIRFARPEKKNALTIAMYDAFAKALDEAAATDAIRVVLIGGADGVFSAGNDLGDFMQNPPSGEDTPVFRTLRALHGFPKPMLAAVDGAAVGIGTTMLLHCDVVYASTRARFTLPFVNLGLVPEAASSLLLPAQVGRARASEWLLFGEPFDAQAALDAGLINAVLPPEGLWDHACARAAVLAKKPPEAVRLTKRLIRAALDEPTTNAMRAEGVLFLERLRSPEAMAAFMAFFTKAK